MLLFKRSLKGFKLFKCLKENYTKTVRNQITENLAKLNLDVKPFNEIPGPKGMPYIGNLLDYKWGPFNHYKYHEALLDRFNNYGPIVREKINGQEFIHLFDPNDVEVVYKNEGKFPEIRPLLETSRVFRENKKLSGGLGTTNGSDWYRIRHSVQQIMMQQRQANKFITVVCQITDEFIQLLKDKRDSSGVVLHFYEELKKWSMESSGAICFGTRLNYMSIKDNPEAQKMIEANRITFDLSAQLKFFLPVYKYFSTPKYKKLHEAEEFFYETSEHYVNLTMKKIKQNEMNTDNFISSLLPKSELNYEDMVMLAVSLFSDGLSTTVPTLVYNMFLLAKNPEAQEKIYQEICMHRPFSETATPNTLNKLSYTRACIKEAFRMLPISTEVIRILPTDIVLSGYHIPARTELHLNHFTRLRSPEYFANPNEFIPERWLKDGESNIPAILMMPFSFGLRTCAGRRFAEQDLQVMLLKLVENFKIQYHQEEIKQNYNILLLPELPTNFTFINRT